MRWLTCLCLAGMIGLSNAAAWTGQSCSSAHRIPVSISSGATGHSDELRVDLVSADFPASYVFSADGDDVRVVASDDVTPIDFSVTAWDAGARSATVFVRLPAALPAMTTTAVNIYVGDAGLSPASDTPSVFPVTGLHLRSRVSAADPADAASALAAFAGAVVDVYNSPRASVTGLNNRALGGTNGDYGWCISAMVEVTPAMAGSWGFRYGGDFGRGGHLYVRGTPVDAQWNDDLWWAGNFANTAETLDGFVTLTPGWHRYEALGFEGCCDGTVGWQAQAPGGAWQDFNTSNFTLRSAQCVVTTATVSVGAAQSCTTELAASKDVVVVSDLAANADPYALPGSVVQYEINVSNSGQSTDTDTIMLADALPPGVSLMVAGTGAFQFVDGAVSSGLSFTYGGPGDAVDSVAFSTDGVSFSYVPTPSGPNGADAAITHVRFQPSGAFAPYNAGSTPEFSIRFYAVVE